METYRQLTVTCNPDYREIIMAEFAAIGYDSFQETATGFITFDENDVGPQGLEEILSRYREQAGLAWKTDTLVKENWNKKWEESYEPIVISNRCIVRAAFHPPQPQFPLEIIITPKMSFGTGHHETTYLMLKAQLALNHRQKHVLDAGCGTGILSVMAGKLGAASITAYDKDKWVIDNVKENLALNNVAGTVLLGTVQELCFSQRFDIILANINKNILLADLPYYARLLQPAGHLLLSGFYADDLQAINTRAAESGLKLVADNSRNNWAMARFRKD